MRWRASTVAWVVRQQALSRAPEGPALP
jgi:hypothetical protein